MPVQNYLLIRICNADNCSFGMFDTCQMSCQQGKEASRLVCVPPDQVSWPETLCCVFATQVYKLVPQSLMLGVRRGSRNIPNPFMLLTLQTNAGLISHLACVQTLTRSKPRHAFPTLPTGGQFLSAIKATKSLNSPANGTVK